MPWGLLIVRTRDGIWRNGWAAGLVVFAHGSGSSRRSPRNQLVATGLNRAGLGTLLVDLLTPGEELSRANVFNVALLAGPGAADV